jgi:hypothetical protein
VEQKSPPFCMGLFNCIGFLRSRYCQLTFKDVGIILKLGLPSLGNLISTETRTPKH